MGMIVPTGFSALQGRGSQSGGPANDANGAGLINANDTLSIAVLGSQFATLRVSVIGNAGTAKVTSQYTRDGINWISPIDATANADCGCPWYRDLTAGSLNPTTAGMTNIALANNGVYEIPLPADAIGFRLLCSTTGTVLSVTIIPWTPYVPGMQYACTLFDLTSAVNTTIDTLRVHVEGWKSIVALVITPAGGAGLVNMVNDTGGVHALGNIPASANVFIVLTDAPQMELAAIAVPAAGVWAVPLPKRINFSTTAVAAVTSRIRIEARR